MVYLDASAVIPMIVPEAGSAPLERWMARNARSVLVTAQWCVTEVASALSLKVRARQMSEADAERAWLHFERACDGLLALESVQPRDFSLAAQLCRVAGSALRAGDGLHLAVARRLKCGTMLSFDKVLNENARASSIEVVAL